MSARDRKAPDWKGWSLLGFVRGWEAVALSMGIDPSSMEIQVSWEPSYDPYDRSFQKSSFRNRQEHDEFRWRLRLLGTAFAREQSGRVASWNTGEVSLTEFASWCVEKKLDVPAEFAALGGASPAATETEAVPNATPDPDEELAALFDPITTTQLQAMFPDAGLWAKWAERASRNGLLSARSQSEPKMFNPFLAARWWLAKQDPKGWTWERCLRRLANNLPPRSQDARSLLTGELD